MPRKSERTRQRIVESANRLFYRQGFHNTSFSDVVAASGVPRGNIYYYFKSKDEILSAAIGYRHERLHAMLEGWSEAYRTPAERLQHFLEAFLSSGDSLVRYGCPIGTLNTELGKGHPALQAEARELLRLFEDWFSDQFAELGYAGEAQVLAQRLLVQLQGLAVVTQAYARTGILEREVAQLQRWVEGLANGEPAELPGP